MKKIQTVDPETLHTMGQDTKVPSKFATPGIPEAIAKLSDTTNPQLSQTGTDKLRASLDSATKN